MKRILLPFLTICAIVFAASCTNDYGADIEAAEQAIAQTNDNLTVIGQIAPNLGDFRNLLTIAQSGDPIVSATPVQDGYTFTFKNNGSVTVHNQTAGISAGYEDDAFFWTLNGQPLLNSGNKVPISTTPEFRINGKDIEVSVDGKKTWTAVAISSDPVIAKVEEDAAYITATLLGGTEVAMPKETVMSVALSGDGSTMVTDGTATVDFLISGKTDDYTVTPLLPEGWSADVIWENNYKGQVIFKAPVAGPAQTARLFFCDGIGNMVASDIDFDGLTVDESFPVMYPAWEAYSVGCEGGQVDITLYINMEDYSADVAEGCDWLTVGGTKAVREETLSFMAAANKSVDMRSTVVTITSGTYEKKVVIWQEGESVPTGENLSANGSANCYIVNHEGDYYFDATVKGNGDEGLIAGVDLYAETAELFPSNVGVSMNINDVISNVRLEDGKIYFHATGAKGNAVITAKDSRANPRVIWSWHIWCTDTPRDRTHTNPDQLQFTVLDRNLGATSADPADGEATHGLYYQWGRKDPFTKDAVVNDMSANTSRRFSVSIQYPNRPYSNEGQAEGNWYEEINNYLWGNPDYGRNRYLKDLVKTIYDPCPVGYMVPPANTFLIFEDDKRAEFTEEGILVHGDYGQINFFPWAGRTYRGFNSSGSEVALWHSTGARWNSSEYAGGAQTRVEKATGTIYKYQGDMRARALPIRCVKQVTE